jgi:hypothetical protein
MVVEPPPPRRLPPQDHLAIDRDEAGARVFTRGVGLVVAAVLVIFSCLLCGQRMF